MEVGAGGGKRERPHQPSSQGDSPRQGLKESVLESGRCGSLPLLALLCDLGQIT